MNIDDLIWEDEDERKRLVVACDEAGKPRVTCEFHCFMSDDKLHDNAFVQHCDKLLHEHYKVAAPTIKHIHLRTDGCAAQYKCASQFLYVARRLHELGVSMDHTFHCSSHGKDIVDAMNGLLKRLARDVEESGERRFLSAHDIYQYFQIERAGGEGKWTLVAVPLTAKKMKESRAQAGHSGGCYRYRLTYIGVKDVKRPVKGCNTLKDGDGRGLTMSSHQFCTAQKVDEECRDLLCVRELSCHSKTCVSGDPFAIPPLSCQCAGLSAGQLVKLDPKTALPIPESTRTNNEQRQGRALANGIKEGMFVISEVCGDKSRAYLVRAHWRWRKVYSLDPGEWP